MTTKTCEALIVEATAGSGKTTTVVDGIAFCLSEDLDYGAKFKYTPSEQQCDIWNWMNSRITKESKVIFLAFNKSIAVELSNRISIDSV
jgi:hypothetical protein